MISIKTKHNEVKEIYNCCFSQDGNPGFIRGQK